MVRFVHRGLGGKYSTYVRDSIRAISRIRTTELTDRSSSTKGFKVAIINHGTPLTETMVSDFLKKPELTFYFGDSCGLPADIVEACDVSCSVSSLPVAHQLEAAIVIQQVEKALLRR